MHALKFSPDVSTPNTIGDIAEQRRAVGEHSAMYTKAKNVPDTSATHRQRIGDARVNIGDA